MRNPLLGLLTGAALSLCALPGRSDDASRRNNVVVPSVSLPLVFVENRGQFAEDVRYRVRIPGLSVDVHADGWSLRGTETVRVTFARGARDESGVASTVLGLDPQRARANYIVAADENGFDASVRDVPTFGRVRIEHLRDGIDLELFESGGRLEYDVHVAPGTPVEDVEFTLSGVETSSIREDGSLVAMVGGREVRQRAPRTLEIDADGTRRELPSAFRSLGEGRYGFTVEGRDEDKALVIDPVLVYSEFVGGSNADVADDVAFGADGSIYVAGWAKSTDFAGRASRVRGRDAVVFKLDPTGRELVFASFFGGSNDDVAKALAVDSNGEVVVVGETLSSDFPSTSGAFLRSRSGNADGFALRISADGSELVWSTFLGGASDDSANDVVLGADGSAYVVGSTRSRDFPVTSHAFQDGRRGARDAFVMRLDTSGGLVVYSTYLGGVRDDDGRGIALDSNELVVVTGSTDSRDFPITTGAFQDKKAGVDAFVTKMRASASHVVFSTLVGGTGTDEANAIAIDSQDRAWIGGRTTSDNFPTTEFAMQPENPARSDGFVTCVSTSGGALFYSSYVGGSNEDEVVDVAVDAFGSPWIVGESLSDDLPLSQDAAQRTRGGSRDAFLIGVDVRTGRQAFGTYLGGSGNEVALGVTTEPNTENIVLVGSAESVAPESRGRYSGPSVGPSDALVARFEPSHCGTAAVAKVLGAGAGVELESTAPRLGKPFRLRVFGGPASTQGVIIAGDLSQSTTLIEDLVELFVDSTSARVVLRFVTDEDGAWTFDAGLPRDPVLCGREVALQAVTFDAAAGPLSFGQLSQGLHLVLGD